MKRAQDNEADSFGITVTMRGKHNCTPAWVSLETHHTVETRTRTHANATKFPPIVITGNTKRFTKCNFKRLAVTLRRSRVITQLAHLLSPHCPYSQTTTHLKILQCNILNSVSACFRLAGWGVWFPVFTHNQSYHHKHELTRGTSLFLFVILRPCSLHFLLPSWTLQNICQCCSYLFQNAF